MVIKIMQYFLHSEIPANTPNWLWYFHSSLSTDLLLRFSWPILCPMPTMPTMPMRAHMPTRAFRRFSRVCGSGPVHVLVSPHPSGINGEVPALTFDPEREDSNSKMEPSELGLSQLCSVFDQLCFSIMLHYLINYASKCTNYASYK